jgi:hypothetical protein
MVCRRGWESRQRRSTPEHIVCGPSSAISTASRLAVQIRLKKYLIDPLK